MPLPPQQLPLLDSPPAPPSFFSASDPGRPYTAAVLRRDRPETYRRVVTLLAEGCSHRHIADLLSPLSPHTVAAVGRAEAGAVDAHRQVLAGNARHVAGLALEVIADKLLTHAGQVSARDAGIVFGIAIDKSELLAGNPTARVAIVAESDGESYDRYLESLRIDAARMGFCAGFSAAKGPAPIGAQVPADAGPEVPAAPGADGHGAAPAPFALLPAHVEPLDLQVRDQVEVTIPPRTDDVSVIGGDNPEHIRGSLPVAASSAAVRPGPSAPDRAAAPPPEDVGTRARGSVHEGGGRGIDRARGGMAQIG